jgi:hypothetical protein
MVTHAVKRVVLAASLVASVTVAAQKASQPVTLTDKDRAEIQQLSAGYALARRARRSRPLRTAGRLASLNRGRAEGHIMARVRATSAHAAERGRNPRAVLTAILDVTARRGDGTGAARLAT